MKDEDEDIPSRDQNNNYREQQGSSFGNQVSTPAHQLRPSGHSKWGNPVSNQESVLIGFSLNHSFLIGQH